jgi:hypothetical protein
MKKPLERQLHYDRAARGPEVHLHFEETTTRPFCSVRIFGRSPLLHGNGTGLFFVERKQEYHVSRILLRGKTADEYPSRR